MSSRKKIFSILEWLVALILLSTCIYYYIFALYSFTAINAFTASEKSLHYGPSEIKKEINLKNGKMYLGKYKDWISATPIERTFIIWYPSSGGGGFPINYSEKISHTWQCASMGDNSYIYTAFGYVNDSSIKTVNLKIKEKGKKSTMKYYIGSDKMFIFCWDDNEGKSNLISLSGLDKDGRVIYDYKYTN